MLLHCCTFPWECEGDLAGRPGRVTVTCQYQGALASAETVQILMDFRDLEETMLIDVS